MYVMCLYCYELKLKENRWARLQSFPMTSTSFCFVFFETCFLIGLSKWLIQSFELWNYSWLDKLLVVAELDNLELQVNFLVLEVSLD